MEASGLTDAVGLGLERGAVGHLGVLEPLDAGEMAVDEHVVGQRPAVLGGLRFGGIRRQEEQMEVLGGVKGTRSRRLVCQPARSSTRTIGCWGPAPTARANSASSTAKSAMLTLVARWKSVRPEEGWTKPTSYRQRKRWRTMASGRCPRGAQTRRRSGLSPMRCSSVAQSSTVAAGCAVATALTSGRTFFARGLLRGVGQGVARPRRLPALLEALPVLPAPLHRHRAAQRGRHPLTHSRPPPPGASSGSLRRAQARPTPAATPPAARPRAYGARATR